MAATQLTAELARSLLDYDPSTGVLTWKMFRSPRARKGDRAGCVNPSTGYRHIGVDGQVYAEHRFVWFYVYGAWPSDVVDHINGVITDNRIENLRDVTRHVNLQNQRKAHASNKTGFLGVRHIPKYRLRPWQARINIDGKKRYLGTFATPEEAHAAYLEAKRRLHEGCTI